MRAGGALRVGYRGNGDQHESFLVHSHFRYLKWAIALGVAALVLYILDKPYGPRYGGTWAGYTLGTISAALVAWLLAFGYRKRSYVATQGKLAERLSAHVYLGLVLLLIATLHTGFNFGWNVHTLAYALMCIVIASGVIGVFCYVRYPRQMTANRAGMTMQQMLGTIATLDAQLRIAAMPLDEKTALLIERAIEVNEFGRSVWQQLTRRYPDCTTAAALAHLASISTEIEQHDEEAWAQSRVLLEEKAALLARVRRDIAYKTMIDIWLYLHVPMSFMLLAAVIAHIVAVFFLW